MPRGDDVNVEHQLVKALVIGDGKCGKSDWAARAIQGGFNVLYLDADVGSQTIAGLSKDSTHPVKKELLSQIYILNCGDNLINGGLDYRFVNIFKKFATASPTFRWNDTKSEIFSPANHGDPTPDEVWEIKPGMMDYNCVLVIDSWTSLAQSVTNWACEETGLNPEEITKDERGKMRDVYQAAGEKLTYYCQMIRSAPCHVIVIAHPREFTKTEKAAGKSVTQKESDMKVLWTKMVCASSSNNHAFGMPKFFTDLAWIEVDAMGKYMIDYRAANDRISGSHLKEKLNTREGGSFVELVKAVGGTIPNSPASTDRWLTIHSEGFSLSESTKKPSLVLGAKKESTADSPASTVGGLSLNKLVSK